VEKNTRKRDLLGNEKKKLRWKSWLLNSQLEVFYGKKTGFSVARYTVKNLIIFVKITLEKKP
jgi:hypothetical protein